MMRSDRCGHAWARAALEEAIAAATKGTSRIRDRRVVIGLPTRRERLE
jgi:chitinase